MLFMLRDCCDGRPEICAPLIEDLTPCCPPKPKRKEPMSERIYNVLFLCTGNSARSILAESILRKDGRGHFRAFSAGSQPKGAVNPFAIKVLKSLDYPDRRSALEELGGIRRARCAGDGFRFHGLRQRCRRDLSGLAWPADDGALGH